MKKGIVDKKLNIEENYFPNQIQGKPKKSTLKSNHCSYCGKGGKLKAYIIADDIENYSYFHPSCIERFRIELLRAIYEKTLLP